MIRFAFRLQGPPITKPLHYRCATPARPAGPAPLIGHRFGR
jgi:hypothetical protein